MVCVFIKIILKKLFSDSLTISPECEKLNSNQSNENTTRYFMILCVCNFPINVKVFKQYITPRAKTFLEVPIV